MSVNGSAEWFLCFLWFSAGHVCTLMRHTNIKSGIWSGAGASLINLLLVQALRWCCGTQGEEGQKLGVGLEGQQRKSAVGRRRGRISVAEGWRQKSSVWSTVGGRRVCKNRLWKFSFRRWLYCNERMSDFGVKGSLYLRVDNGESRNK